MCEKRKLSFIYIIYQVCSEVKRVMFGIHACGPTISGSELSIVNVCIFFTIIIILWQVFDIVCWSI